MLGMVRLRIDAAAPRARTGRTEVLGNTPFLTAVLQLHGTEALVDRIMVRQSLRMLALRGAQAVAAPDDRYINAQLARYNMDKLTHWPLMRAMAGQILDRLLGRRPDTAVLLYARSVDRDVMEAAWHAARHYRMVMLDFGVHGETVRRRLMDGMGASVLLSQVGGGAPRSAALFFDAPQPGYRVRLHGVSTVALCPGAARFCDFDGLLAVPGPYEPLGDTDREAVLGAVASNNPGLSQAFAIGTFIKK